MSNYIDNISEILKEEKWTRMTIADFKQNDFESFDPLIVDIANSHENKEIENFLEQYLKNNSNSIIALYFLSMILASNQELMGNDYAKKLLDIFDENRKTKIVKFLCEKFISKTKLYKAVLLRYIQILEDEKKSDDEIVEFYEMIIKLDFTDTKIGKKLAQYYENHGIRDKAIYYYKKVFDYSLNSKNPTEIEELFKKLLEFDEIDEDYFYLKIDNTENLNLKIKLGEKLIEHFEVKEKWESVISTIKIIYEYLPDKSSQNNNPTIQKLREKIIAAYLKKYESNTQLEACLQKSQIREKWKSLGAAITDFERYIPFDINKYVFHQLSGLGFIKDINVNEDYVIVDFDNKKGHKFSIDMALKALKILDDNDFRVLEKYHPEILTELIEKNPSALMISLLKSFNKPLNTKDIKSILTKKLINEKDWNKTWDKIRNNIKDNPLIIRDGTVYSLRTKAASKEENILQRFKSTESLLQKSQIYLNYLEEAQDFDTDTSQYMLKTFLAYIPNEKDYMIIHENLVIAYLFLYQLKQKYPQLSIKFSFDTVDLFNKLIEEKNYIFNFKDTIYEKDFFNKLMLYSNNWQNIMGEYLLEYPSKFIVSTLISRGYLDIIKEKGKEIARNFKDKPEIFLWFVKNVYTQNDFAEFFDPVEILVILANLLDITNKAIVQKIDSSYNRKLYNNIVDLLFKDKLFENYLLTNSPNIEKVASVFLKIKWVREDNLIEFKTLLAKYRPEILTKIAPQEKEESDSTFYSTTDAIKEKQNYLQNLLKVEIPRVNREMMLAKEKGDLRENAEYHSARELLQSLNVEAAELQKDLNNVKPIDFNSISCDVVSIGTRCVLLEKESQKKYVYTILGKWDIDINNNIISYETELGKILLNKKVGDEFVNPVDEKIYSILSIEKASN